MIETVEVAPHIFAKYLAELIVNDPRVRSFDGLSLNKDYISILILEALIHERV